MRRPFDPNLRQSCVELARHASWAERRWLAEAHAYGDVLGEGRQALGIAAGWVRAIVGSAAGSASQTAAK